MTAHLRITAGPHDSQVIPIQLGQVLRVGRTQWADVCLARDSVLLPVHFSVEFTGLDLLVTDLSGGGGLRGSDGPFREGRLCQGTRFQAGQSEFLVELAGDSSATGVPAGPSESIRSEPAWQWRSIPFSKQAGKMLGPTGSPSELLNVLLAAGLYVDAWLMVSHRIGAIPLVKWLADELVNALGSRLTPEDAPRFAAVRQWAQNPGSEAMEAVRGQIPDELDSPGAWIAQAVAWTTPNLLPDSVGQVPTPPGLCPRGCAIAVTFLAMTSPQGSAAEYQARFLHAADRHFQVTGTNPDTHSP